jgi:hypothetical protein
MARFRENPVILPTSALGPSVTRSPEKDYATVTPTLIGVRDIERPLVDLYGQELVYIHSFGYRLTGVQPLDPYSVDIHGR